MRQRRVVGHAPQHVVVEAKLFKIVKIAGGAIEQTHDDAFAVQGRQRGNAQVDFAPQRLDLDAAVLREPSLGDIQLGHQLDARNNGGLQFARRRALTRQHAIDAVADAKLFFERLDVDVAGALLDRLPDHGVHQPDHGRFTGHVAEVFEILRFAHGRRELGFVLGRLAVVAVDGVEDFLLQGDPGQHRQTSGRLDRVASLEIQRIGHGERDRVIVQRDGKAAELTQKSGRERFELGRDRGRAFERQHRNLQLFGQRRQHIAHGDEAQIHHDLAELLAAALFLNIERAGEIVRSNELPLDEDLAQAHG